MLLQSHRRYSPLNYALHAPYEILHENPLPLSRPKAPVVYSFLGRITDFENMFTPCPFKLIPQRYQAPLIMCNVVNLLVDCRTYNRMTNQ